LSGQASALGRILIPLSDVLWATGEPPSYDHLQASFDQGLAPFRREYTLRFLPELKKDCWNSELALADCFDHRWSQCAEPEGWGAFGCARIKLEVTLKKEVRSLIGLYFASMVVNAEGTHQLTQPRCVRSSGSERPAPPLPEALADSSAESVLRNADLRNVFSYLARLSHSTSKQGLGFIAWLREDTLHGYVAAVVWLVFCAGGFFPCSLWLVPIYGWLLLLGNGLLAARQRKNAWSGQGTEAMQLFWKEDLAEDDQRGSLRRQRQRPAAETGLAGSSRERSLCGQ